MTRPMEIRRTGRSNGAFCGFAVNLLLPADNQAGTAISRCAGISCTYAVFVLRRMPVLNEQHAVAGELYIRRNNAEMI